jgi:hypothetical protein
MIVPQQQGQLGKVFTMAEFAVFFYRICIFTFDHTDHGSHIKPHEYNLVKKLLYVFQKIERSPGMLCFMQKIGKTYSNSITFLPSRDLLFQIVKCEGLYKYFEGRTYQDISK